MVVLDWLRKIYKPRFTNKEQNMSKCRLNIGGSVFIVDIEQGLEVFKLLNGAVMEKLDYDYISKSDSATGQSQTLYFLKSTDDSVTLSNVSADEYAMWKLYTASRENEHE